LSSALLSSAFLQDLAFSLVLLPLKKLHLQPVASCLFYTLYPDFFNIHFKILGMTIVADCGSTKCDWLILHGERNHQLENTVGFSPFFHTSEEIKGIVEEQLLPKINADQVTHLWFYGTGVHDDYRAEIVSKALTACFPNAQVEVEHDLLGAARAVCGHNRRNVHGLDRGNRSTLG
jgi:hypothetical protein